MNGKYVVSRNPVDGLYRVVMKGDAPYGISYGGAYSDPEDAVDSASRFLGISPDEIGDEDG